MPFPFCTPFKIMKDSLLHKKNIKYCLFLSLIALYFISLGSYGLMNPDEGRYAEIPREMLEKGDFITPTLNYVLYFEKPVLHYWQTVLAFSIFGQNEFAARFFPCFLGILGVFFTWLFARIIYTEDTANLAAVILGTSILYFFISRINIIDMPVSTYITISLFSFYFYHKEGKKRWGLSFYGAMALATLSKGLIGIILPCGTIFWFMILTRRWDIIRKILYLSGISLFFLMTVPWFYLVCQRNPDFFYFFFIQEHFLRYTTQIHERYQPLWFFIPFILCGFFPWTPLFFISGKEIINKKEENIFLLVWIIVIFLFFSISSSKLIPYIIPIFPPLAIILAKNLLSLLDKKSGGKILFINSLNFIISLVLLIATILIFYRVIPFKKFNEILLYKDHIWNLCYLYLSFSIVSWLLIRKRKLLPTAYCLFAFLFLFFLKPGFTIIGQERSNRELCANMLQYLQKNDKIVMCYEYEHDISFYIKRRIILFDSEGELLFGQKKEREKGWFLNEEELEELMRKPLEENQKIYFLIQNKHLNRYLSTFPLCRETKLIEKVNHYNVYAR